jgi:hypothetical protein
MRSALRSTCKKEMQRPLCREGEGGRERIPRGSPLLEGLAKMLKTQNIPSVHPGCDGAGGGKRSRWALSAS